MVDQYDVSRRTLLAVTAAATAMAALPLTATAATAETSVRFTNPSGDSRPMVLWFWNGTVTEDLVDAQLADLRSQGIQEVLVFPFETDALRPTFFSEEWFTLIEHVLREADRHGMRIWLFNDNFFPSGRAGGFVVKGGQVGDKVYQPRPDLRLRGIMRGYGLVEGGGPVRLDHVSRGLSIENGRLVVDAQARDGITLLREGADWQDYDITAKVKVERATAGLMFRCADEANGYLADLRADGALDIWRQSAGSFALLSSGNPLPGFDPSADHELKVQVHGSRLTASVDGISRPAVTDATFAHGRVGVRATATQRSSWDRLTISDLYDDDFTTTQALDSFDLPTGFAGPLVAVAARPAGSTNLDDVRDLTSIAQAGTPWQAPPGNWQIDVFTSRTLVDDTGFRQYYLDLLDDEAVRLFLDIVAGEYVRRFPWAVGGVLRGFADDEPFLASASAHFRAIPWSAALTDELANLGTTPAEALCAVHDDFATPGRRLAGAFWRAVSNRYASSYYRQQGEWMNAHGIEFISNPLWDEFGPAEQLNSSGNLHTTNQWAQIPGTDLIGDHYEQGYHRTLSRWPASTAHQLGKDRVYLEAMGATGWAITPAQVRKVIGSFAVRGVNKTLLHAVFSDEQSIYYPPPFQRVNPWWPVSAPLYDWIGRVMEAGRAAAIAQTALLQPQRAIEAAQGTAAVQQLDKAFLDTAHALEDEQIDFDLLDEGALSNDPALRVHAQVRNGVLAVGPQRYRTLVVPATTMLALDTVRTLTEFVQRGGSVVVVGPLATIEASGDDAALARAWSDLHAKRGRFAQVPSPGEAARSAVSDGRSAIHLTPAVPEVRALRLRRDGEPAFLIVNERTDEVQVTATLPADGIPEVWDADTGQAAPAAVWRRLAGRLEVPLALGPNAAILIVVRPDRENAHATASSAPVESVGLGRTPQAVIRAKAPGLVTVEATDGHRTFRGTTVVRDPLAAVPLDGDWTFRFDKPGAESVLRPLGSWSSSDPAYSGAAFYRKEFTLTPTGCQWQLDLGEVHEVAEVSVNGTSLPAKLWPPYQLDLTALLRPGNNVIEVRVTNTGANAHGQSTPSGLLGPVVLQPQLLITVPLR